MVGWAFTVTAEVALLQFVVPSVNVNVDDPADKPVTKPPLVTEAIVGLLLAHVPLEVGESVVVFPEQTAVEPVILTVGKAFTLVAVDEIALEAVQLLLLV